MRSEPPNHSWQAARTGRIEAQRGLPPEDQGDYGHPGAPEPQGAWPDETAPARGRRPRRDKRPRGVVP
ncbi:hypothetical protein, partial [Arthrobacter woluwensis]